MKNILVQLNVKFAGFLETHALKIFAFMRRHRCQLSAEFWVLDTGQQKLHIHEESKMRMLDPGYGAWLMLIRCSMYRSSHPYWSGKLQVEIMQCCCPLAAECRQQSHSQSPLMQNPDNAYKTPLWPHYTWRRSHSLFTAARRVRVCSGRPFDR